MEQKLDLSPTVQGVQKQLSTQDAVYAVDIVNSILKRHSEYAKGSQRPNFVSYSNIGKSQIKPIGQWLADVRELFDTKRASTLHGRMVIIGLGMLDGELNSQLNDFGFLNALIGDLKEPIETVLSNKGREVFPALEENDGGIESKKPPEAARSEKKTGGIISSDRIGSYSDAPVNDPRNDELGRAAYARYLIQRILGVQSEDAFSIHIGGPWGSGKSTLLNFMKAELKNDPSNKWVVVEFNAWQNQHIRPPWWPILDALFQKSKKNLSFQNRLKEHSWRIMMGRTHYFFGVFLLALVIILALKFIEPDPANTSTILKSIQNIGSILAAIIALWAGFQGISGILLSRSAQTAESYLKTTTNPMEQISKRFGMLVKRIAKNTNDGKGTRVAIIIDDMDRCQTSYVVDLLEGIQTLFRQEKVVFIVAADRRWLHACFEDTYQKLKLHVQEPGKGLGTLFLEKVFQFVVPIPGIPEKVSDAYWLHLLKKRKGEIHDNLSVMRNEAKKIVDEMNSEIELLQKIEENSDYSFTKKQLIREEAIVRLAAPELSENIENHTLAPFAALLNPNPRAMKRLVNAYSINRALSTLGRLDIPQKELALWTILSMRWPSLANHLEGHPDDINQIKESNEGSIR